MAYPNRIRLTVVAVLLVALTAHAAWAATVDPLLRGLQAQRAGKTDQPLSGLDYARLIALEDGDTLRIGAILELADAQVDLGGVPGLVVGSRRGTIATARLPLSSLDTLAALDGVAHVAASHLLQPMLDIAVPLANVDDVWAGTPAYTGAGVLVGVIDSGIDWRHQDFDLPSGQTRIKAIWDLFATGGTPPAGFAYGVEYTEAQINAGTAAERDFSGHGTHVSGMAAGNGRASSGQYRGVAYEADILFAKPWDDQNGGFPEDKTIDAMRYMAQKAASLGQPIAINMSLGGHYGAHDGTSAQERVVDELAGEGVVFCIAAGNEGESFIHDQASAGGGSITYRIVEYEANPGSNNDFALMIIWVDGSASPGVSIQGPGIDEGPIASGQVVGGQTAAGYIVIDNASQGANPQNGDKLIVIQFDDREGTPPAAADWTITISGGVNQAHAWHVNGSMTAGFPDSDHSHSVAMPAGAAKAITVAAYKSRNSWPAQAGTVSYSGSWGEAPVGGHAPFSSIGPTRDGRQKPDIAAPGMAIVSCYSQDTDPPQSDHLLAPGGQYYATQGTSMASPFTCGVVALMLEKNGALTADQIKTLLQQTAITDDFTGPTWNARFGAGKIDALAAVAAVSGGPDGADGDIDGDGRATVLDLILLVNHILDPVGSPLTGDARTAADVYPAPNGDGNLDAQDLARIVAFILGTDTPGLARPASPAIFTLGEPERDGARWLVPVHIGGEAIAAGQFALTIDGAVWSADELGGDWPASLGATAHAAGDQLRVLFYDLGGELPAGGISFQIPVSVTGAATCAPRLSGLLLAAAGGEAREVQIQHDLPGTSSFLAIAPNPAPGATTISFRTGRAATGSLEVYDLRGRRVRLLQQDAGGGGAIGWDGRDDGGRELPAGVYMVRLVTPREAVSRKVVLRR